MAVTIRAPVPCQWIRIGSASALAAVALLLPIAAAQEIPVLTLCEVLHEAPKHNGALIIVVAGVLAP
jgi:hypothetical protein